MPCLSDLGFSWLYQLIQKVHERPHFHTTAQCSLDTVPMFGHTSLHWKDFITSLELGDSNTVSYHNHKQFRGLWGKTALEKQPACMTAFVNRQKKGNYFLCVYLYIDAVELKDEYNSKHAL